MIIKRILVLLFLLPCTIAFTQNKIKFTKQDTSRVNLLLSISKSNFSKAPDSAISYAIKAKELADSVNYAEGVHMHLRILVSLIFIREKM